MMRNKAVRPLTDLLLIFAGPSIWFAHFTFIYGIETLICIGPSGSDEQTLLWTYALATIFALAGLGFLLAAVVGKNKFLPRVTLVLALLAIPAVIWTAVPTALLSVCAS
jgi:hypothetical protein